MTSEKTTRRAAIYARISNDPDGNAIGVHDQAKRCRDLAAQRGWTVAGPACGCGDCKRFDVPADIYCDNDITASGKRRRPHYEQLLADITAGRVDVVVAAHTDRLHRSPAELEGYINACEPRKVATHTVLAGEMDLTNSTGRMVARMLGAAARHELERMMERQKAAKRRNREAGLRWAGTRPFGYALDGNASTGLVIIDAEAAAIRGAYDSVLAGVGYNTIGRQWTDAGLRTPVRGDRGGKPWRGNEVKNLLLCARNAGLVEHDAGDGRGPQIIGPARWEAIVSEDTWRAARDVMLASTGPNTVSPGPTPRWWLQGAMICGVCGCRRFRCTTNGKHKTRAYQCASMLIDSTAPGAGWHLHRNAAALEEYVEAIVLERLSRPDVVGAYNRPRADVTALDTRRMALRSRLDELGQLFAAGGIDGMQLTAGSVPLRAEIEQVEQEITQAWQGAALEEFAGAPDVAAVWDSLTVERKRAVVRLLLRVKVLPTGRTGRVPFIEESVKILPPDA